MTPKDVTSIQVDNIWMLLTTTTTSLVVHIHYFVTIEHERKKDIITR